MHAQAFGCSSLPCISTCTILSCSERYAVATEDEVTIWCVRHEQEYTELRGGHTRAVVALYACGDQVRGLLPRKPGVGEGVRDGTPVLPTSRANNVLQRLIQPLAEHGSAILCCCPTLAAYAQARRKAQSAKLEFRIFSASTDGSLRVWDPTDMNCMHVVEHNFSEVNTMTFHEARNTMITGACWGGAWALNPRFLRCAWVGGRNK